jgi:hypothetical protein
MFFATVNKKKIGRVLENHGRLLVSKASVSQLLADWLVSQRRIDSFHIYICHSGSFVNVLPKVKVSLLRITGYVGIPFMRTTKEVSDNHIMVH